MKLITFENIKSLGISPYECYQMVSNMVAKKEGNILPGKIHMNMPNGVFCNVMPSVLQRTDSFVGGVKVITRYPQRIPSMDSMILIFDAETGKPLALMDGNWITAMRTGAVAAHSIVHLAKKDFSNIGIIGLGNTARATLLVLLSLGIERDFNVKLLRYKDQAENFINRFKNFNQLNFSIVDTPEAVVKEADVVISCATYFDKDICSNDCFDEGVTVIPVHTRGFTNCDLFFDKIFADDTGHVDHFSHFRDFKYYAEVCDVVNGKAKGRENDSERILVYNIGISIHDINFASCIYNMMDKAELQNIDIEGPTEKFWI